ncbi:MAG: folate-binding protein [Alphaproteobacteria bacterium]|jgi:hypothetical protein|nr:folate-binding protein [Alphaproteobacteria bacterium]MDP7222935.1 folate-binding protein [Alphaproteobacteria bacterium]
MSEKSNAYFVRLKNRGLIHIEGDDRKDFLQDIVTNDINGLSPATPIYSCLLSPQGKFLHDFFMIELNNTILLDCEGGERAQDLFKRLKMYSLRRKVTFSVEDDHDMFAVIGTDTPPVPTAFKDPRHPDMGWRVHGTHPEDMPEKPFDVWDEHRIRLCVPDGSRDMEIDRSTMLECNIDTLHGVSFTKGCFIGQELTARMNYRGLSKKHLYAMQINDTALQTGDNIQIDGKTVGTLRSHCNGVAIAQIKKDALDRLGPSAPVMRISG